MNRILLLCLLVLASACPRLVPGVDCRLDGDCDELDECIARICTPRTPVRNDAGFVGDVAGDDVQNSVDAGSADVNAPDAGSDVAVVVDAQQIDVEIQADAEVIDVAFADVGFADAGFDAGAPADVVSIQDVIGVDVAPECVVPATVANLINIEGSVERPGQDGSTRRLFVRNVVQGETILLTAAIQGDATATLSAINVALTDFESETNGDVTILHARGEVLQSGNASVQVDSVLIDATSPIVIGLARYRPKPLDLERGLLEVANGAYVLNAADNEELTLLGSAVFRDRSHVLDEPTGLVRRFTVFGLSVELTHQPACGSRTVSGTFTDTGPAPFSAARLQTLAPGL